MIDCREIFIPTQRQEEWDFFHKRDYACEEVLPVQIYQSYRYLHLISVHLIRISLSGIAFKYCSILAPHRLRNFNVLECHGTVLDLVAVNTQM